MALLDKLKSASLKKIFENFLSLSILNIVNFIFPLLIIPILIKRLGVENYGIYIFAFTILNYLNLLVQYGFNFSATNKIAKNQNNSEIISLTYSSISIIRSLLSIIIIFFLLVGYLIYPNQIEIYLLGSGIFLGQGLIPVWLFQGLEKMKFITVINLVVRLIAFLLILIYIKTEKDMGLLMGLQSISFFLGAIISCLFVQFNCRIDFRIPSIEQIKTDLKEGWQLFLSTIGMNFYRESNIIILGMTTNYYIVGLYAPAEKLVKAIQSFTNIIVTALYPHFSRKFASSGLDTFSVFQKTGRYLGMLFLVGSIVLCLAAPLIIKLYLGTAIESTIWDLRILSFIILFGGLNYYYGIIGMVNMNLEAYFSRIVWISGIISLIICFTLSLFLKDIGASIAMISAEIVLLLLILRKIK
ncbi:PST family polysaccharide transporter [Sphingobacterium alimentarium]|uniref:PST family polysaccharide transporter n=1 Tax=Sphingobacterium alimentarium TaxID=797292 RepID=A0A4R3VY55_9SPHI|nr:oligosaccharide flippase family protein [Sphingobacterium alimentarium]TCV10490.1 PST family polysaccharide transporter [Sphingobacterium alimentarium]